MLVTKPNVPSVNTVLLSPKIDSWQEGWETEWEKRLRDLAAAEAELERRERQRPRKLSEEEKKKIVSLGSDLRNVWTAPTTTDRDRKELLRTLLEEVIVTLDRPNDAFILPCAGEVVLAPK